MNVETDILCFFLDTFDVVREAKDHVFLLDFSPFGEKYAESYAFNWSELEDESDVRWI